MINRWYHLRVEVKATLKQEMVDKREITVMSAVICHKSWFADPDRARLEGYKLMVEKCDSFTEENCMPVSFSRC